MNKFETQLIDAQCLIECLSFGECSELYKNWDHGIYEFRDRVSILSEFSHECWLIITGDDDRHCDFDAEFCPAWLAKFMRLGMYETEFLTVATGRRFAREILAEITEREPVTISRNDFEFFHELATIRRDQWRSVPDFDALQEIWESDQAERDTMAGLITELLDRTRSAIK